MITSKFILIIGGGRIGYYLCKALQSAGNEVVLIERDKKIIPTLRQELGDVVISGDGTELAVLRMAGIERADVVVTTTGYDEDNYTIALMAKKKFNVPKTVSRLRDPNNEGLFKKAGIDQTVSSTRIILNILEQQIDAQSIIPITALDKGNIEVVELTLDEFSPTIGVAIKDLGLPSGYLIISIIRNDISLIPQADLTLVPNDTIILLLPKGETAEINKYFINS